MSEIVQNQYSSWQAENSGKWIYNGFIYVGQVDTDPEIEANQVRVFYIDENEQEVDLSQPVRTNSSGFPVISETNSTVIQVRTDSDYSVKALNRKKVKEWYIPKASTLSPVISTDDVTGLSDELRARAIRLTIDEAKAGADLEVGQYVYLIDRGLGLFKVQTGIVPDEFFKIDIGGGKTLVYAFDGDVLVTHAGAKCDGSDDSEAIQAALDSKDGFLTVIVPDDCICTAKNLTLTYYKTLQVDGELILSESDTRLLNMLGFSTVNGNGRLLERLGAKNNTVVDIDATGADNYQLKDIVIDIPIETEVRDENAPTFATSTGIKVRVFANPGTPSPKNSYVWNLSIRKSQDGGFLRNIDMEVDLSGGNCWIHDTDIRGLRSQFSGGALLRMVGVNFVECVNLNQQGWTPNNTVPAFDLQDCNTVRFEGCNSWDRPTPGYDLKNCKKISIRDDVSEAENPGFHVVEDDLCEDNDYFMDIWGDVNTNNTYRRAGSAQHCGNVFLAQNGSADLFTIGNMANGTKVPFTIRVWMDSAPVYAEYKGFIRATVSAVTMTVLRAKASDGTSLFPAWVENLMYSLDASSNDKQVHFRYLNQYPAGQTIGYEVEINYATSLAKGGTPKLQRPRYQSGSFVIFTETDVMNP